jgi:hypothetical protein
VHSGEVDTFSARRGGPRMRRHAFGHSSQATETRPDGAAFSFVDSAAANRRPRRVGVVGGFRLPAVQHAGMLDGWAP